MTDARSTGIVGPHQGIQTTNHAERFACSLFDRLWDRYRSRVSYVATYEKVVTDAGATFVNDHIAFRTLTGQRPTTGISSLSRVYESLGYRPAGVYDFPDKHLNAIHYQHVNADFPKLFISELKTWELPPDAREVIHRSLETHRPAMDENVLAELAAIEDLTDRRRDDLLNEVETCFHDLPWPPPQQSDVERLNKVSQYAAWVLVHGYNVNHFTSLVNSHGVAVLDGIEKTIDALKDAGVPMKATIEGEHGSKLRQSATEAVVIDVHVQSGETATTMPWTYAYFELAERNPVADPITGEQVRFEGFLGPQATQLFEMTRLDKAE